MKFYIKKIETPIYSSPTFKLLEISFEQDILGGSGEFSDIPELGGIEWP